MGRSLTDLLANYLDDEPAAAPAQARRADPPELRAVLETARRLAAAVVPASVVGVAYSPGEGPTVVRLAGVRDVARSLDLGGRLADDGSRGLADVEAEHFLVRAGDRLRLGVDRGGALDGEQRGLLQGVALLASRALARSGGEPLGPGWRPPAPSPSPAPAAGSVPPATPPAGPDRRSNPAGPFGAEVA
jgi:hypothetical protein